MINMKTQPEHVDARSAEQGVRGSQHCQRFGDGMVGRVPCVATGTVTLRIARSHACLVRLVVMASTLIFREVVGEVGGVWDGTSPTVCSLKLLLRSNRAHQSDRKKGSWGPGHEPPRLPLGKAEEHLSSHRTALQGAHCHSKDFRKKRQQSAKTM
jgi:hypothetical protein